MDSGSWARPGEPTGEIEVFPTGRTLEVVNDGVEVTEHLRHGLSALKAGYDRASSFHARPGPRPGAPVVPATSTRRGGDADVVRPVLIEPALAAELAVSGVLFRPALDRLTVSIDRAASSQLLVWDVELLDDHHTTPATLHLLAAPSMVVTVLELIPRRRLRWTKQRFIDGGIEALDMLAGRLLAARPVGLRSAG